MVSKRLNRIVALMLLVVAGVTGTKAQGSFFEMPDKFLAKALAHRDDIPEAKREEMSQNPWGWEVHSDWFISPYHGKAYRTDGETVLFADQNYKTLKPLYPGLYIIGTTTPNSYTQYGVVSEDGTEFLPIKYGRIQMDEYGFIKCEAFEEDGIAEVYTYDGRLLCTYAQKAGSGKYEEEYRLYVTFEGDDSGMKTYHVYYLDGTEALPAIQARNGLNFFGDYCEVIGTGQKFSLKDLQTAEHSDAFYDYEQFMLPVRQSIVGNKWMEQASALCDAQQWEGALNCLQAFHKYDYQPYMTQAAESLLYPSMWLQCQKALGNDELIKNEFPYLCSYNLWRNDTLIYSLRQFADTLLGNALLNMCREIAYPVVIPDREELLAKAEADRQAAAEQEKRRQEAALASIEQEIQEVIEAGNAGYNTVAAYRKAQQKAEQRQRRAEMWGQIFMAVGQSLSNVAASYQNAQAASRTRTNASSSATSRNMSVATSSSTTSSSTTSSTTEPTRKTCSRCKGTGTVVTEHSFTVAGYGLRQKMETCSTCGATYDAQSRSHKHERCPACKGQGYNEYK